VRVTSSRPASQHFDVVTQLRGPVSRLAYSGQDDLWYAVSGAEVLAVRLGGGQPRVAWKREIPQPLQLDRPAAIPTEEGGLLIAGFLGSCENADDAAIRWYSPNAKVAVLAYDMAGNRRWAVERNWGWHADGRLHPWPPIAGEVVLLDGDDLRALDVRTGRPRWTRAEAMTALWETGDLVLLRPRPSAGRAAGNIVGLDATTGRILWERHLGFLVYSSVLPLLPAARASQPGSCWLAEGGRAWCVEVRTGRLVRTVDLGRGSVVWGVWEGEGGPVLIGKAGQGERAVEAWDSEGRRIWRQPLFRDEGVGPPVHVVYQIASDFLYVFNGGGGRLGAQVMRLPDGKNVGVVLVQPTPSAPADLVLSARARRMALAAGRDVSVFRLPSCEPAVTVTTPETQYDAGVTVLEWVSDTTLAAGTSSGFVLAKRVMPAVGEDW
jgi:outer membrane protein assembly factor BamB